MFESHPGSSDPFSAKPSPHEQRFQSLMGYGREQQSGVFEAVGERAQRATELGRGVLGVIQRVDMVGSTQAGLDYVGKAVGAAEKVLRGLFKAAFNLFRTGGRSGVDALSEAGKAGARAAGASVFEQGQAYSPQATPDNSPFMSSEPYEPFGPPKPYVSYEEPPDPFANLSFGKTDRADLGGSLNRPEDIDIWGSVSTLSPGAIPPPPPPPSNRLQRTPGNPYGRW